MTDAAPSSPWRLRSGALVHAAPGAPGDPLRAWDLGVRLVEPEAAQAYADVTADRSVTYYGADAIVPPLFHSRLLRDGLFALFEDPSLDIDWTRLLHAGHDVRFHRHLHPWEAVAVRGTVDRIEHKRSGRLIHARILGFVAGRPVVEARTVLFVRHAAPEGLLPLPGPASDEGPPPDGRLAVPIPADQAVRYGEISQDDNPLHRDPEVARAAGFEGVVLHGLCTLAMCSAALMERTAYGDSRKLRRLAVRFSAPVLPGQELTVRWWGKAPRLRFDVRDARGITVLEQGLVELEPDP